jgi:very-short-patch-repair endonuclease
LELSGFMYEKDFVYQYPVKTEPGLKFVDFCIPKLKLLVECDGEYWHPNKDKDAERDKIILSVLGDDWRMEHLSEKEIYEIKHFLGINENE